jgi:hypothetical protein
MLLSGPVRSSYPGKYVFAAMAVFMAVLISLSLRASIRISRENRHNTRQGITTKPDPKKSVEANVAVAFLATYILVLLLFGIYKMWPN